MSGINLMTLRAIPNSDHPAQKSLAGLRCLPQKRQNISEPLVLSPLDSLKNHPFLLVECASHFASGLKTLSHPEPNKKKPGDIPSIAGWGVSTWSPGSVTVAEVRSTDFRAFPCWDRTWGCDIGGRETWLKSWPLNWRTEMGDTLWLCQNSYWTWLSRNSGFSQL